MTATDALTTPAATGPLLAVHDLHKDFPLRSPVLRRRIGTVRAVDGVSLAIEKGETLGLVGESGSGKSTTARLVLRLIEPTSGVVEFSGTDLTALSGTRLRRVRRNLQMVFQDPFTSLDPRQTVLAIVGEPLRVHSDLRGAELGDRVAELLGLVGLDRRLMSRYPHEFSGGQRQRIAVARSLASNPQLLVCDEPVSSLDVSTQSQVINLLADLQRDLGLAYLFISHDLAIVRHVSHRIAVMYLGRIVEIGDAHEVYEKPAHPYTRALLAAIPLPDPRRRATRARVTVRGDVANPAAPPTGCHFHPRCPDVMDVCRTEDPPPVQTSSGTTVRCHLHVPVAAPKPGVGAATIDPNKGEP
jgi:oligopeptide/dipeptide ABC transporter ATP-binding protein